MKRGCSIVTLFLLSFTSSLFSQRVELVQDSLKTILKGLVIGEDNNFIYHKTITDAYNYGNPYNIGIPVEHYTIVKTDKKTQKAVDQFEDSSSFGRKHFCTFLLNRKYIFSCYTFYNDKNKKRTSSVFIRDVNDFKKVEKINLLQTNPENFQWLFMISPDSTKFSAFATDVKINSNDKSLPPFNLTASVLNSEGQVIWEANHELRGNVKNSIISGQFVTNNGVIFFNEKLYHIDRDTEWRKEKNITYKAYDYFLARFDKKEIKYLDINIEKDVFVPTLNTTHIKNEVVLSNLYQASVYGARCGLYYAVIDLIEFKTKTSKITPFTNNWRESLPKLCLYREKLQLYPSPLFNVCNVKVRADGSLIFFCERIEHYFYPGIFTSYYQKVFYDLIVIGISPKEDLLFTKVIPKWITSLDSQPHYSFIVHNDIYIFYTDHPKNIKMETALRKRRRVFYMKNQNLIMAHISRTGQVTRTVILDSKKDGKYAFIDYIRQKNKNTIEFCTPPFKKESYPPLDHYPGMQITFD